MRDLTVLDRFRDMERERLIHGTRGDSGNGFFKVFVGGKSFLVIASDGGGWDHVSVTTRNGKRCPTWEEMCAIKDMFFYPEECVVQYHPAKSEYVNIHEHCLHLWRPQRKSVPMPPIEFV